MSNGYVFRGILFLGIGLALYAVIYAGSEALIDRYAERNRFYNIKTATQVSYDFVILGASHGMPLDFEDMNSYLQKVTGTRVLNLSTAGAGIVLNRMLLEYFLATHSARNVLYILDSFVFYSAEWNEERVKDTKLYLRAPLDMELAAILLRWDWPTAINYVSGFSKINNQKRFERDISEDEATRFGFIYRPNPMIDRRRMKYLYPENVEPKTFQRYLDMLEEMLEGLKGRGIRLIVMKPPIPEHVYKMIPGEAEFDRKIKALLSRYGVDFYDFAHVNNDKKSFYNTDHLNRIGARNFIDGYLKDLLIKYK